jgi:hypothetical protein
LSLPIRVLQGIKILLAEITDRFRPGRRQLGKKESGPEVHGLQAMKKKTRSPRKRRQTARHAVRTTSPKRRTNSKRNRSGNAPAPWLRLMSSEIDDELRAEDFRNFFSPRNGRRQPRNMDLYIPEDR